MQSSKRRGHAYRASCSPHLDRCVRESACSKLVILRTGAVDRRGKPDRHICPVIGGWWIHWMRPLVIGQAAFTASIEGVGVSDVRRRVQGNRRSECRLKICTPEESASAVAGVAKDGQIVRTKPSFDRVLRNAVLIGRFRERNEHRSHREDYSSGAMPLCNSQTYRTLPVPTSLPIVRRRHCAFGTVTRHE
jgi:hypothetical protein